METIFTPASVSLLLMYYLPKTGLVLTCAFQGPLYPFFMASAHCSIFPDSLLPLGSLSWMILRVTLALSSLSSPRLLVFFLHRVGWTIEMDEW